LHKQEIQQEWEGFKNQKPRMNRIETLTEDGEEFDDDREGGKADSAKMRS